MVAEVFSSAVKKAAARQLGVMELLAVVNQLTAAGETSFVVALYRTWLEHNAGDPIAHAMYFNYGVVLSHINDNKGAKAALEESIRLKPDFLPPYINLGTLLERMGATGDAVNQWYAVVNKLPAVTGEAIGYKTTALKQIGRVLEKANFDVNAEEALHFSLDINPDQPDVIQHWLSLRQRQCKWPVVQSFGNVTRQKLLGGFSALSLAAHTDDPLMQMGNAYMYCKFNIGAPTKSFARVHRKPAADSPARPLKIGYLSSDLREHAIGFLTAEIYELHDRAKVEVFAYYCGIPSSDDTHNRIKAATDHWLDISEMADEAAAQKIIDDGIDILVDVNGYTNGARTKLLAMRPAPVIVNWLGFPGTMASPYHNYILADEFIIPESHEIFYTEKVLRLPCYQPNDRKRVIASQPATRRDAGLPEDATVYCCFNGLHKITRFTWLRWMSILKQVPGSVLWLLDGTETTNAKLRELAAAEGVAPERIVFAAKKRNPDHLARYPLADLFLDTSPYGAHTTSSDAMWMGVPVITHPGRSFASRVCGSLIKSAGLPELICDTPGDYVAKAVALGSDKAGLAALRRRLAENRDTCVLFDTPRLVASLESLYAGMWRDYLGGNLPRPNLVNLDIYNDIGVELDRDDVELLTVGDYLETYKAKLTEKSDYSFLLPDGRLWP